MALTITSRGTGTHNTGATTLVPNGRSATLAVGSLGVLAIALDNAGSAGSTLIAPDAWTDAKGNVWTLRQNALYDNGAASAGIEMAFYTAPITVALLTTDAGTMTWKTGVSPVAKAWTWYEVIPPANAEAVYQTGGTIAGATAANAQVTTASIAVGDGVIAGYFSENVAAVTGDSDTTNGTWTAQQTATVGSTTSGVRIATQQKVQTTTASTQSYDVTVASQDRIAGYIAVHEQHTANGSAWTATGGGVAVEVAQKGAQLGATATGGGVYAQSATGAHTEAFAGTGGGIATSVASGGRQAGITVTGGGSASPAGIKDGQLALAATGGGVLTWDYEAVSVENHNGSFAATGAGIAAIGISGDHLAELDGTGGGTFSETAEGGRIGALTSTGAGALAMLETTDRASGLAATGSGIATLSVESAREFAFLLSGGGVVATDQTTDRLGGIAATGGGSASVTATQGEEHSGAFAASGGGVWDLAALSDRLAAFQAVAGGQAATSTTSARLVSVAATGGGRATISTSSPVLPLSAPIDIGVVFDANIGVETTFAETLDIEVIP